MAKQAGLSAKQRENIDAALLEYGAHLTEDNHIARGGKVMGVRLEVKGGRLRVEGGGNLLASYPVSHAGKGISDFVKAFWFWKKAPTEALLAKGPQIEHSPKKSPAQIKREVDEFLAGRHGETSGAPSLPKHQRFRVDIQNQPRRIFDSAVEALSHGARHVYLRSSETSKMLGRLERNEPVAWSYGFESVEIAPL